MLKDYPYQLKLLQNVGWQTYMFVAGSPFLAKDRAVANCIDHGFTNPLKQHRYLNALGDDYSTTNSDAIEVAEASYAAALTTDILVPPISTSQSEKQNDAAAKAAVAFFAAGGDVYQPNDGWILAGIQATASLDLDGDGPGLEVATATAFAAAVAAVVQSALASSDESDSSVLAATFIATLTGLTATEGDKAAIKALLADETAYAADESVVTVAAAARSDSFASGLLSASATIALLVPNILLPRASVIGTATKTVATLEATYASQKDWTCGEARTGELETAMQLLMSLGYWWRPTYGAHWTYDSSKEEALSAQEGMEAATKVYFRDASRDSWSPTECFVRNDDAEEMLGDVVAACMLPWAPQMGLPIGLVFGDIAWNLSAADATAVNDAEIEAGRTTEQAQHTTLKAQARSGIERVGAQRLAVNDFSPAHWLHARRLDTVVRPSDDDGELTTEEREALHKNMQQGYIDHFTRFWQRDNGTGFEEGGEYADYICNFAAGKSISDILDSATAVQKGPTIVVYVLMILYVGTSLLGWKSNVRSHFCLGIGGVVAMAFAVVTSLGAAAWFGVLFTPVATNVAPFIALGIGVDDMLVIAHEYAALLRQDTARPLSKRQYNGVDDIKLLMTHVLEIAGPSCLFTTMTNFIAFMVATVCPIRVVMLFAQIMTIMVVMNFLFLLLFFVPMIYFDARRVLGGRRPECCCIGNAVCSDENDTATSPADGSTPAFADADDAEEESSLSKVISTAFKRSYGPFLMKPAVKVVVLVLFGTFFAIQVYFLTTHSEYGMKYAGFTVKGTYQHDFYNILEEEFVYYNQYIVQTATNFASPATQVGFQMSAKNFVLPDLVEKSAMAVGTGGSWLTMLADYKPQKDCANADTLDVFSTTTLDGLEKLNFCDLVEEGAEAATKTTYIYTPEDDFYYAFGSFLNGLGALMSGNFVCKNTDTDTITPCFGVSVAYPTDGTPLADQPRNVKLVAVQEMAYLKDCFGVPENLEAILHTRIYTDQCQAEADAGNIARLISANEPVDAGFWSFPTGYTYRYNEQYLNTKSDMVKTVGFAALGIFLTTFMFMLSWKCSAILCLVIVMTVVELAGIIPESDAVLTYSARLCVWMCASCVTVYVGVGVYCCRHVRLCHARSVSLALASFGVCPFSHQNFTQHDRY
jgi:hypothetical protein